GRMRDALSRLNADMVMQDPFYVVRITGSDAIGKSKLRYFISVASPYPVIATTSKLLSTGLDCKMVKLIVLDQMIGSMTEFKQIIGRGTRLNEAQGKTHFVIMDFRNVTHLFADPDWDGPIEVISDPDVPCPDPGDPYIPSPKPREKCVVDKHGCNVEIIGKSVSVYDTDGKLLRQESIIDYTKSNILGEYASLEGFIHQWSSLEKKETISSLLLERGIDLEAMKAEQDMADVDDYDFICHVAFNQKPLTRRERANNVKKRDFLNKYKGTARDILEALLDKYMNTGIYEIEKTDVLKLEPLKRFGKLSKIMQYFGGKPEYLEAVNALKDELYKAG
ncbi:MAG TPA: type I restriction-modification enzyme R subunit C-terminal domain-containing protein, partial [Clostridia bacterium]|nr:type I restriction-modification enzyme R subunit C-terminal domain-containing protein [Clostridia bacterium]